MLRLHQFKKSYGDVPVLQIESLVLQRGVWWLKGENGSGKTSFFASVAGLIPCEGTIEAFGINIRKQRLAYTKVVSFAAAEPVYPSFLTANELIRFYLQTKGEDETDVRQLATAFGMNGYLAQQVGTYSSGMVKKLSLLLCFIGNPKLLLLDEPFITLDVATVGVLQEYISQKATSGTSFLISSHQELSLGIAIQSLRIQDKTINVETDVASA